MSFYTSQELDGMGFKYLGDNVKISRKASIYNHKNISIGDHSRIDDFAVLSAGEGGIYIGRNVHIAIYSSIMGQGKISLDDFSGISSRVSIYSSNDDYSGAFMTNPTVGDEFTNVSSKPVFLSKHVIVGSGSIVLPGVELGVGVAVGALSLVTKSYGEFVIISGSPARKVKERRRELLNFEADFLSRFGCNK
ncbi:acyltransferase [Vibrio alginolyticus]|uniref:acyltransferase n=1 Tax=Vibrio TaxID=662 RepID=UPI00148E5106|nr:MULTISPECIES: acyltransferase [Vibrio]MCQ9103296.1 acyltransferase [Vibrio alginolyticus]MDW2263279.1 acyltransferase [Vibrio sp. 1557]NOI43117.1 acyltransferase [Vibrio alginolyticus]HBC3489960.1 acyltransferase [Vibrio alginolyticus]